MIKQLMLFFMSFPLVLKHRLGAQTGILESESLWMHNCEVQATVTS